MFPPLPGIAKPAAWIVSRVLRMATIATMPGWMRDLGALRQPRIVDWAIRPLMKVAFRISALSTQAQLIGLSLLSPRTRPVVEPVFLEIRPLREETLTPAEARQRYQSVTPLELCAQLRSADEERAESGPGRGLVPGPTI